ncbi:MAG TPA: zinc-binding dehydrogenase [Synergistales bacterium]|nr:alcohol dehydrogenase [Synergistaceae bacterium]HQQ10425.1 zinc-binding dehydrogenase [Synergistales bacterium]
MKAIVMNSTGTSEVLSFGEHPLPEPAPGEALVRLEFAAVNHLDIWVRIGNVPVRLPIIPGSEGAGVVEATGEGAEGFSPGREVVVTPWIYPEGHDHQPLNAYAKVLGVARDGCYARYASVPASCLRPVPPGLSLEEAAGFTLVGATAYHMTVTRGGLKPGERVFVMGATGGVGIAAIQIARASGAVVFAATRDPEKRERLREVGAHEVFDTAGDYQAQVREATGGIGVDLVVETVGKATWDRSLSLLRPGGRLAFCGSTSGSDYTINLQRIYRNEISLLGCYGATPEETGLLFELAATGGLRPVIDSIFPLEEAREAHERMERSEHFGKILLGMEN